MGKTLGADSHVPSMAFMWVNLSPHAQNHGALTPSFHPVLSPSSLHFEAMHTVQFLHSFSTVYHYTQYILRVLTEYTQYASRCKLLSFLGAAVRGRHPAPHPTRHTVPPCKRQHRERTSSPAQKTRRRRQTSPASAQRTSSSKLSSLACRRFSP